MTTQVRGRPRDPRVDQALTRHLVELLATRGPDGFSVDELAARSGVGKAAIYRRYRTREELLESGFAAANEDMPVVRDLPVREALVTLLEWVAGRHAAGMTPTWLVAIQQMPQLRQMYIDRVVQPRRQALREVLERGRREGLFAADVDIDVALTCLSSPAVMLGMHRSRDCDFGSVRVEDAVDLVLAGLLSPEARANGS